MTGAELKHIRKTLKLTQAKLAELLQVHEVTIGNYEIERFPIPKTVELAVQFLAKPDSPEPIEV